jgi:UDP-2,3-diacylglucosamine pyrophosphatase LpxH
MMGHPEHLEEFLRQVSVCNETPGEELELVINGDFVDFLAEPPFAAWNFDEMAASRTLAGIADRFPGVVRTLKEAMKRVDRLTVTLGNHDVELALPKVRAALRHFLGVPETGKFQLITNNEAYRVGDLLIEHGNRYDSWNAIDYDGLRHTMSMLSRGEAVREKFGMKICPGSRMVEKVINPLKKRYTFIDLLKPENKVVSFLLTALEPAVSFDLPLMYRGVRAYVEQWLTSRPWLASVTEPDRSLACENPDAGLPEDIQEAFADELRLAGDEEQLLAAGEEWRLLFHNPRSDSLRSHIEENRPIDQKRLRRVQVGLKHALEGDFTFDHHGPDGPYYEAAKRLVSEHDGPRVVLMGHTHHHRETSLGGDRWYLNTGTWVDLMRVPQVVLEPDALTDFGEWLRGLVLEPGKLRYAEPTFADIRLDGSLKLVSPSGGPMLRDFSKGGSTL